jgi:hypothetical protein
VSVCKRLQKEVTSYQKEVVTNEARVQKMKDEGRDEYGLFAKCINILSDMLICIYRYSKTRRSITRKLYDDS